MTRLRLCPLTWCGLLLCAAVLLPSPSVHAAPQSPAAFLGGPVGADRTLYDWSTIVAYLEHVDAESDRVEVQQIGQSTEGRPFLLVKIADAEGLRAQDQWAEITHRLLAADSVSEEAAVGLARTGRAVVAFSLGVHSTEVGASQAAMEMVYRLATQEDEVTQRIRSKLLILLVPSMNPDGLDLVNQWYMRTVGTPAEGTRPLELYHPYAGHDNNRDGFFNNLVETAMWSRLLYHDWLPQVVVDEHQMGSDGPRLFLPPFDDPISGSVHALVYSQLAAAGQQAVSDLTARGWKGIATSTIFTAEWPGSVRSTGFWHNMLGILSETASARLATPLYFPPGSLRGSGRGLPEYERRANFLEPWPGGWWRLRDIVDIEIDLTWALLRWASDHSDDLLLNFWRMNRDAIEQGRQEAPFAFVVPCAQHDPGRAKRLVEILRAGGLTVDFVGGDFGFGDQRVVGGAWVVPADQAFRPFLLEMLGAAPYPMVREGGIDGSAIRPYDVTAWRLDALLGVRVLRVDTPEERAAIPRSGGRESPLVPVVSGRVADLPASDLATHAVIHGVWAAGGRVQALTAGAGGPAVAYRVELEPEALARIVARAGARTVEGADSLQARPLRAPRIALFSPWGGSMDEGWTRLLLDRSNVAHRRVRPGEPELAHARDGARLRQSTDVLVLPSIAPEVLREGVQPPVEADGVGASRWPQQYRRGLGGAEAGTALRRFVEMGGTLVAINHAVPWVVDQLGLPVQVELQDLDRDVFYAPGTLLRGRTDPTDPLAAGMPDAPSLYFARGYALRPLAWPRPTRVAVRYAEHDLLVAGFLQGAERLRGRPALVEVPVGEGRVVLFGFSPQRRAQTEGTFGFFLNALLRGAEAGPGH